MADALSLTFPLLSDPDLKTAIAYGVAMEGRDIAIPAIFVVNGAGEITFRYVGESPADRPDAEDLLGEVDLARTGKGSKKR
jgi:peroxiredoxin